MSGYLAYNQAIREAAAAVNPDPGVLLIEGEDMIPGDGQRFADSVHFTDAGCQKNAERIADALVRSGLIEEIDR